MLQAPPASSDPTLSHRPSFLVRARISATGRLRLRQSHRMPCGAQCMRDQTTPKWSHLRLQLRDHALVFGRHVLVAVLVVLRSQPPRHRAHLPTQNLRPLLARVVDVKQGEPRRVQLELHSRSADACLPLPEHAPGSGRKSLRWADADHAARSVRALTWAAIAGRSAQ